MIINCKICGCEFYIRPSRYEKGVRCCSRYCGKKFSNKPPWNKGLKLPPLSKEHINKIREANIGNKYALGFKHSEDTRLKMSNAKKGKKYRLGIKSSIATRIKQSIGIRKFYDKKGRKKYKRYIHLTCTKEYKNWRTAVFERDNWTCQTCGIKGCYLEAHHIKSWAKFPKLRFDINNGKTLCKKCHKLTDNYKNKKYHGK